MIDECRQTGSEELLKDERRKIGSEELNKRKWKRNLIFLIKK